MKATDEARYVVMIDDGTKYVKMQHRYIRFTTNWYEATFFTMDDLNKMLTSSEAVNQVRNQFKIFTITPQFCYKQYSYHNAVKANALNKLTAAEIEVLGLKRMIND